MLRLAIYTLDQDADATSSLGIYRHTSCLIHALARQPDPGFAVHLWVSESNHADMAPPNLPSWMQADVIPGRFATGTARIRADQHLVRRLAARSRVGAVHFPKGWTPWLGLGRSRIVATIHDTIVQFYRLRYPGFFSRLKLAYLNANTHISLRQADAVLTISEFSRGELSRLCPRAATRIHVVSSGPTLTGSAVSAPSPANRILVQGSRLPHKATRETLERLGQYADHRHERLQVDVTGLPARPPEWPPPPENLQVRFHGRVSDDALRRLLSESRALVLLSEIEGLGLPLLEAYALGTPVCYRDAHALHDVMQGAMGGWDSTGAESFFRAMDEVRQASPRQIDTVRRALTVRYNWDLAAQQTVAIYQQVLASDTHTRHA